MILASVMVVFGAVTMFFAGGFYSLSDHIEDEKKDLATGSAFFFAIFSLMCLFVGLLSAYWAGQKI